jgi:hypothetical protein
MANIDYAQRLLERSDAIEAREAVWRQDDVERIAAPFHRVEAVRRLVEPTDTSFSAPVTFSSVDSSVKLAQRLDALWEELERALTPLKRCLSILPAPPRMALFQREAKDAWLRFHQGDPEPLDTFIRKHIVRLKNREGPVPSKIRTGVMEVLDECFAPVLIYAPGDWYFFGSTAQEKVVEFARGMHKKNASVSYVPGFADALKPAVIIAWDDVQWATDDSTQTLLNRIDVHLRRVADDGPKLLKQAEKRPHLFLGEASENPVAQFEAREFVQQQVETLPRLIEKAALSPKEHLVYEYDSKVGTDFETIEEATEAAALHLNRSREDVRSLRFRRRQKLREAIASDADFQEIFDEIAPAL